VNLARVLRKIVGVRLRRGIQQRVLRELAKATPQPVIVQGS
jgi:uncharacterized protein YqfA (UPF0365 family)